MRRIFSTPTSTIHFFALVALTLFIGASGLGTPGSVDLLNVRKEANSAQKASSQRYYVIFDANAKISACELEPNAGNKMYRSLLAQGPFVAALAYDDGPTLTVESQNQPEQARKTFHESCTKQHGEFIQTFTPGQ